MRKGSPPPIHEIIVKDGKMTQALVRYLFGLTRDVDGVINEGFDEFIELITKTSNNITLKPQTQALLVDATFGEINIKLPPPNESFSSERSINISIQKIDTSENIVNIVPNGSELVVGETSQELILDGEIYNFITDGADWYLGA